MARGWPSALRPRSLACHSAAQLQEERQRSHDAQQHGEAFAVLVTPARISAKLGDPAESAETGEAVKCPVAVVINNGHFTITNLDAPFVRKSALYLCQQMEYYSAYPALPLGVGIRVGGRPSN